MTGINTSGVPTSDEYLIGRGILQLAELNANGTPKSFKDVGNVPEMSLSLESDKYEHYSSRAGLKTLDKSVVIQQTGNLSFVLENVLDFGNLAYFFSGEASTYTNPAVVGHTDAPLALAGTVLPNAYYVIVDSLGNPLFQIDKSKLVVKTTNGTPVTLTVDVDYTVDTFSGQVFLKDTEVVQTVITGSEGLTTTYTADVSAASVDVVKAQTKTAVTVAARFISENASTGAKVIYDMHKVTLSSDGDFGMISDEAAQAPMTGSIEKSEFYEATMDIYAPGSRA